MSALRGSLAIIALVCAGCATDIPSPRGNEPSAQTKLRATHHWDVVANDIAKQTKERLDRMGEVRGVVVQRPENPSVFERAMHDLISTRLVETGTPVLVQSNNALKVSYSTQLVRHSSSRATVSVPLVAVAAGIMAGYNIVENANAFWKGATGLGAIAAVDYARGTFDTPSAAAGGPSKTELIVTTTVSDDRLYLVRKTDV